MKLQAIVGVVLRLLGACLLLLVGATACGDGEPELESSGEVSLAATAQYHAGDTIQAEALSRRSTPNPQLENNNTTLGFFDVGTWFCFDNVDLTSVTGLDLRIAAANTGGVFSVRLDSSTGTEVGRYTVSTSTGGWGTWQTRTLPLTASTGAHSLCLRGETGYGILNLDWFKLNAPVARYRAGDTVQAEALTSSSSPNPKLENSNTTLGFFDAGTWFCFAAVDMTSVTGLDLQMAAANTGGVLSVRLDSSTGAEVGRYTVSTATGGWGTWQTRTLALTASSGVRTLCLRGETGYGILNLDWLKLNSASTPPTTPPSTGDIVGKVSVGYQGWFTAPNDGSGVNPGWWHWTPNRELPTSTNIGIKSWPDMNDFAKKYATGFANLGSGASATLFSSYDSATVDTHLRWMQDSGIDTVAIQRFADFADVRDTISVNVRTAAEARGRKFYIMYDITGWTDFQTALKSDWDNHIIGKLHLTDSSAYARQDGKPVVCLWGLGFLDRPGTVTTLLDVINYFKNKGIYVIGGVPRDWRVADGTHWGKANYGAVYDALNAISPWMVGVIGDSGGSDYYRKLYDEGDVAYCHSHGIHYQPCVLPGDLQERQRKHGDFMWHQFGNMIQIGSDALYVSMFDEYNEGNQIAKTAATAADKPAGSSFLTLDEDGTACTSDYYLRLTGDGGKMLKKQIAFTFTRPTLPK